MTPLNTDFEKQLEYGRSFEDRFSKWMMSRGYHVIPKYLYQQEGAPSIFGKLEKHPVPDIDAAKKGKRIWVECKRKRRMLAYKATGYSLRLHNHYKRVQEITGCQVFVVFEDDSGNTIRHYGNYIDELEKHVIQHDLPCINGGPVIVFDLDAMIEIKLEEEYYPSKAGV